jgi:hypothetical protein
VLLAAIGTNHIVLVAIFADAPPVVPQNLVGGRNPGTSAHRRLAGILERMPASLDFCGP